MNIFEATKKGDYEQVKCLLENGTDANEEDEYGDSGLLIASYKGYFEIVKLLLDYGANVNRIYDFDRSTSLMHACASGHFNISKLLLNSGAKPHVKNCFGVSTLSQVSENNHLNIQLLFLKVFHLLEDEDKAKLQKAKYRCCLNKS